MAIDYLGPIFAVFFFSSRRRHTRSLCDWSSDVCSSDLVETSVFGGRDTRGVLDRSIAPCEYVAGLRGGADAVVYTRSEERRVGKESGARWMGNHTKKNGSVIVQRPGAVYKGMVVVRRTL